MFSLKKTATATLLALAMISTGALAKGSPQDVAKLGVKGTPLTPTGAERAGNKDGTIPAWDGGITQPPAGYKVGDHHQDPFAGDKPLLTITPENYKQYAEKLNAGQMAMFEKYKDYKMLIYPTRRSAAFPARIYEMSIKNAATGELIDDGDGLINVAESIPFPILDADPAKAGYEAIWNHKLN